MQTVEPVSTKEATKILEFFYSTCEKSDLEQVASTVAQLDAEEKTRLIGLLKYFEGFLGHSRRLGHKASQPSVKSQF